MAQQAHHLPLSHDDKDWFDLIVNEYYYGLYRPLPTNMFPGTDFT